MRFKIEMYDEVKANDLVENHLFKAGAFLTANLRNTDIWGEYSYLANKLDWKFRYDRKVLGQDTETDAQKIRFNRFALTSSGTSSANLLSAKVFGRSEYLNI